MASWTIFFHTKQQKAQFLLLELNLDSRNTSLGTASRLLGCVWSVCVYCGVYGVYVGYVYGGVLCVCYVPGVCVCV